MSCHNFVGLHAANRNCVRNFTGGAEYTTQKKADLKIDYNAFIIS